MGLSTIQWTDYTFNPWIGCRKVAAECANCYAETLDKNRYSKTLEPGTKENPISHWGSGPRHRTKTWGDPVKWNRQAGKRQRIASFNHGLTDEGAAHYSHRPRVFCASLADWLDDENVPIEWLADLLKLIHDTPNLDWLLLTKRPQNWWHRINAVGELWACDGSFNETPEARAYHGLACEWRAGNAPANIWIGVSAGADQSAALDIPARIHFLSCEPMLRPLEENKTSAAFDWAIFGGESGSKARRCDVDWIEEGVAFCRKNGIAPFVKQLGSQPHIADASHPHGWEGNNVNWDTGRIHLKDSHGGDMDEWPEDLRVRCFPEVSR